MRFGLMRHGEAELTANNDFLRELTPEGRHGVLAQCKHIQFPIHKIITSPYVRAQQTAKLVAETLAVDNLEICEEITPDGDVLAAIRALDEKIEEGTLIVCHMPIISYLTSMLVHGHANDLLGYQVSEIAWFEAEFFAEGQVEYI